MSDLRDKLIEHLDNIEECAQVVEIESKSWHDFWVVQRAVVRALWVILVWILRREKSIDDGTIEKRSHEMDNLTDPNVKGKVTPKRPHVNH